MARFDLTDEEWAVIEPLLPPQGRGPQRKADRNILNGIFYVLRTGAPWRDLPERYGPRTTIYNRYNRWGERVVSQFEMFLFCCFERRPVLDELHWQQMGDVVVQKITPQAVLNVFRSFAEYCRRNIPREADSSNKKS